MADPNNHFPHRLSYRYEIWHKGVLSTTVSENITFWKSHHLGLLMATQKPIFYTVRASEIKFYMKMYHHQ